MAEPDAPRPARHATRRWSSSRFRPDDCLVGRRHAAVAAGRARRADAVLRLRPRAAATRAWRELRAALPPAVKLHYAMKANPMPALVVLHGAAGRRHRRRFGAASCASRSTRAPIPHEISFAGPGKSAAELRQAVAAGVLVNVESLREVRAAREASRTELGCRARVARARESRLRAQGSGMKMGGGPKQFGVDAEQVPALLRRIGALGLAFEGFHLFAGSQNLRAEAICEAQRKSYELALRLARARPGAGARSESRRRLRHSVFPRRAAARPRADRRQPGATWPSVRSASCRRRALVIELGRYLVGEAGIYVCRVVDRKVSRGQVFLVTDGGLHHHLAAVGQLRPGDSQELSGGDRQPDGRQPRAKRPPSSARCARRSICSPIAWSSPVARAGRPRRRVPVRRVRRERQPAALPRPPGCIEALV